MGYDVIDNIPAILMDPQTWAFVKQEWTKNEYTFANFSEAFKKSRFGQTQDTLHALSKFGQLNNEVFPDANETVWERASHVCKWYCGILWEALPGKHIACHIMHIKRLLTLFRAVADHIQGKSNLIF